MAIDTFGWDVVNFVDTNTLNTMLRAQHAHPASFSSSTTAMGLPLNINGVWSDWSLDADSSGKYIVITCPIENGTFCIDNKCYEMNVSSSPLSYVKIMTELEGYSADPNEWEDTTAYTQDIIKTTTCATLQFLNDGSNEIIIEDVFVASLQDDPDLDLYLSYIKDSFKLWFNDNMSEFKDVFSAVILNPQSVDTRYQWIKPSAYSYATASVSDSTLSGYGTVALVESATDTGSLQQAIDIRALELAVQQGGDGALVISHEKCTKHFLLRILVHLIKNSTENDFIINPDGLSITTNKDMVWGDFQSDDGKVWSPVIPAGNLLASIDEDVITFSLRGLRLDVDEQSWAQINYTQYFRYQNMLNDNGDLIVIAGEESSTNYITDITTYTDDSAKNRQVITASIGFVVSILAAGCTLAWQSKLTNTAEGNIVEVSGTSAMVYLSGQITWEEYIGEATDEEIIFERNAQAGIAESVATPDFTDESAAFSKDTASVITNLPISQWMVANEDLLNLLSDSPVDGRIIAQLVYPELTISGNIIANNLPPIDYICSAINESTPLPTLSKFKPRLFSFSGGIIIGGNIHG